MRITIREKGTILLLELDGRLDAFGSSELAGALKQDFDSATVCLLLDMSRVDYISSAGLRILLPVHKELMRRDGALILARLQGYCREVLEVTGVADVLPQFDNLEKALASARRAALRRHNRDHWDHLETAALDHGAVRIMNAGGGPGAVEVLGDVRDVLHARVTPDQLLSKRFFETEYSIGLGGLGRAPEDFFEIMGEMMTIGGTMVWLPTDGHDTPDFLIPKTDKGHVMIRTGYNISLAGGFDEFMVFESREPSGTTISQLYRDLFQLARRRRPDCKGLLGLALRAQAVAVYGSGVLRSPVAPLAPANGGLITDPSNIGEWMACDREPRHRNVTMLMCGVGADLAMPLDAFDSVELNKVFYLHPANIGAKTELLHNHAVLFKEQPFPERPTDLEDEIQRVVQNGEFVDMRHLLDNSCITRALIGVSYIQTVRPDPHHDPSPA
ncbi:MAG TPA: STAS domain-containing protein [Kiritimatiellia bacterium]|nr:STAS domain-containing protein [Kiritimatiellia bacterium]HRZ11407.1 STAS domain-containing protein [Kiritimatiellia bacterium]HSA17042.1 STAS domain-containing protein [Kiritimatiellia bacterium]